MRILQMRKTPLLTAAAVVASLAVPAITSATATSTAPAVDCSWADDHGITRAAAFARASSASGVPVSLLKAVSYMESRWDHHDGTVSAAGGYGPMHLTDSGSEPSDGKGDGTTRRAESTRTMALAATLTGVSERRLRTDPNANICGGAAVLASYQRNPSGNLQEWDAAVSRYGVSASGDSATFARQVYATLRRGESRRTDNGDRVALAPHRRIAVPSAAKSDPNTDCPDTLNCEWIEAPYERTNETGGYGNHDLADRTGPGGPKLRYIVIHGTESNYQSTINAVQDPTYVSWNYTIRSSDGHIAQHLEPKDVGYHAGNWWMNTHSIGLEHEGKSGTDAWWTESLYQNSATLVRYLTAKYDIARDRSHIIGHDQIPGILPGRTQSMHWDPGPYWDWEHYMRLLKAPIADAKEATKKVHTGDVVTVRPGYADNTNEVTGCDESSPGSGACDPGAGTNFVYLHQGPDASSPLAKDIGSHPDGSDSTTRASDIGARAAAGTKLVVADRKGSWLQVSWAGEHAWLRNSNKQPVLVPSKGAVVRVKDGLDLARTYGRAYPEAEAYPDGVTPQAVVPIEYQLKPGQAYVVGDRRVITDYYKATTYDGSAPGDWTDFVGETKYYWVWTGHRQTFVPATDVDISASR